MRSLLVIVCVALLASNTCMAQDSQNASSLSQAIQKFNADAAKDGIGKDQPPLTEDEVVAAIRLAEHSDHAVVSDALFATFKHIADTRQMPPQGEFEILDGLDRGGDFIFDVWYVRIRLPKEDGGSYAFTIRNRIIRARPVGEVADELEKKLKEIPPVPGRYRLEDRVRELKARAAHASNETAPKN